MKKHLSLTLLILLFLLIIILAITCKSSPRITEVSGTSVNNSFSQAAAVTTVQPAVTTAVPTAVSVVPETASAVSAAFQQQFGTTTGMYNRHTSGVILDGAANYTVRSGDTLTNIAGRAYQDGSYYPLIMMVSGVVLDPDLIYPGTNLVIPDLRVNMNDSSARQSINRYFLDIARIEEQRGRSGNAELIRNHTR
jgi:LysM repeat protein